MKEFPEVAVAIEEAQESRLDEAETSLDRNIKNGMQKSIEFFLKNKGKSRGYGQDPKDKDDEIDLEKALANWQAMLEAEKPSSFPQLSVIEVDPNEGPARPKQE